MIRFQFRGLMPLKGFFLAMLLSAVLSGIFPAMPAFARCNILFVVSEDNGPALSCYGAPVRTPCLDALARQGVRFASAYVPQAGCSQSRAAFLTGRYPHQNGQIGLATWKYAMFSREIPNVVTTLKRAGYRTGIIGKLHVNPEDAFPFDFKAIPKANFKRRDMGAYAKNAAAFFGKGDRPFYLQVNYPDAHWPFLGQVDGCPANPLTGEEVEALPCMGMDHPELKQLTADYYNCMMRLDSHVGDLLNALDASGKAGNTAVVYIGDHGADLLRGKRTCYEGGVKIPMIIRWPGAKGGQVREELVSTIDLFPTFCAMAGIKPPASLPGRSLKAIVEGGKPAWRNHLFTQYHVHSNHNPWPQRAVRNDRFKLIWNPLAGYENPGYAFSMNKRPRAGEKALLASATPQAKQAYALMKRPPEFELYDLRKDPHEFRNLADDPACTPALSELTRQLRDWQKRTGDAMVDRENAEKLFNMIQGAGLERKKLPYRQFVDDRSHANAGIPQPIGRPNILFLAVDDMNDWASVLEGYDGQVHTPNIDGLAKRGMTFCNAACASPVCCPSRTAVMLGQRPSTTGIYNNGQWWRPHLPEAMSLPMYFRRHGYTAAGAGKIFHHPAGFNPPGQWDDFQRLVFCDDPWFRASRIHYPWTEHQPYPAGYPFSGIQDIPHEGDWGVLPGKGEADYDDARTAQYAIDFLKRKHDEPFFLACGMFRPHLPWYAPKKYFDLYPLDAITLPQVKEDDLDDIPAEGRALSRRRREDFQRIKKAEKWKQAVQAYLACISFSDAQVGRVLDALRKSPYLENTIIVLWSDHGWHLGEKDHWHKSTLWEEAARIPFIWAGPGISRGECRRPVDTLCIYPTLLDLCGLPPRKDLDGVSIATLLENPDAAWDRPAVTEFKRGQCAVRSQRYRYIRYSDGGEELYDHQADPGEWKNLADDPVFRDVKKALGKWVTAKWAEPAPGKRAYRFDHESYTWTKR